MKVDAIQCPKCKDIIYSRARHDMHCCSCNGIFVDGGFDYLRRGGRLFKKIKDVVIEVDATKKELYDDWNLGFDKWGIRYGKGGK